MKIIRAVKIWHCWMCLMCWVCLICPRTHLWPAGLCFHPILLPNSNLLCSSKQIELESPTASQIKEIFKSFPPVIYLDVLILLAQAIIQSVCWEKIEDAIFDSCWRKEVSNFCSGMFGEVGPFCGQNGADVDINTKNSKSNSGSNETMQNVLAPIV